MAAATRTCLAEKATPTTPFLLRFNTSTYQWTWLKGSADAWSVATFGLKGESAPSNTPGSTSDGNLLAAGIVGFGIGYATIVANGFLSDVWQYNASVNEWTFQIGPQVVGAHSVGGASGIFSSTYHPGGRYGAIVMERDGLLLSYMYGGSGYIAGDGGSGLLADLWVLDITKYHWSYVIGDSGAVQSSTPVFDTLSTFTESGHPGHKFEGCGWGSWPESDYIHLFAGYGADALGGLGKLNDFWTFNCTSKLWAWSGGDTVVSKPGIYSNSEWFSTNNKPGARQKFASSVNYNFGFMYVWGGEGYPSTQSSGTGNLNDLWATRGPTVLMGPSPSPSPTVTPSPSPSPTPDLHRIAWWRISGTTATDAPGVGGPVGMYSHSHHPGARYDSSTTRASAGTGGVSYVLCGIGYHAGASPNLGRLSDLWAYRQTSWSVQGEWAFMGGISDARNEQGVYSGDLPRPGARHFATAWVSSSQVYLFAGMGYDSAGTMGDLNDLWIFNCATYSWVWLGGSSFTGQDAVFGTKGIAAPANHLGAGAGFNLLQDGDPLLFGGHGKISVVSTGMLADTWKYEKTTNQWAWVNGPAAASSFSVGGEAGIFSASYRPGGREKCVVGELDNGAFTYLFGGDGKSLSSSGILADLWVYDIASNQWAYIAGNSVDTASSALGSYTHLGFFDQGQHPGGRRLAAGWAEADSLYVFAGYGYDHASSSAGWLNDFWVFNASTRVWAWAGGDSVINRPGSVPASASVWFVDDPVAKPASRYSPAVLSLDNVGQFAIFGGYFYSSSVGADMWVTRGPTRSLELSPTPSPSPSPTPPLHLLKWRWLSGGSTNTAVGAVGAVGQWSSSFVPTRRSSAMMTDAASNGVIYLMGGVDSGTAYGDLWGYRYSKGEWAWLSGLVNETGYRGYCGFPARPGARSAGLMWHYDSQLWLFGGHGHDCVGVSDVLSDLWSFDLSTSLWRWVNGESGVEAKARFGESSPGGVRWARIIAQVGSQVFWFGGVGLDEVSLGYLSDVWMVNATSTTSSWSWLNGPSLINKKGVGGASSVFAQTYHPGGRQVAAAMSAVKATTVYVFGGYGYGVVNDEQGYLGDLWGYDVGSNRWAYIAGNSVNQDGSCRPSYQLLSRFSGGYPGSRQMACGFTDPNSGLLLMAYGAGYTEVSVGEERLAEVWAFNTTTKQWAWAGGTTTTPEQGKYVDRQYFSTANWPGSRFIASHATDRTLGYMFIFGGLGFASSGAQDELNDLWVTRGPVGIVPPSPTPTATPSPTPSPTPTPTSPFTPTSSPSPTASPSSSPTTSPTSSPTASPSASPSPSPSPSPPPQLFYVSPKYGPVLGGTALQIVGTELHLMGMGITVTFDGVGVGVGVGAYTVPGVRISIAEIQCTTPSFPLAQSVSVRVQGSKSTLVVAQQFTYYGNLTLTRVYPPLAPTTGGVKILIEGVGIPDTGSLFTVRLDNITTTAIATSFQHGNSTAFIAPARSFGAGGVILQVAPNAQQYVPNQSLDFKYYDVPHLTGVSPPQVQTYGGMNVTVEGTGFFPSDYIQCRFADTIGPGYYVSSTAVKCLVPKAELGGVKPLQVSMDAGNAYTPTSDNVRIVMVEFVSDECRRAGEVTVFVADRQQLGLYYFPNLAVGAAVTTSPRLDNYDSSVGRSLNPSQLVDGDRCCEFNLQTYGYKCGTVFSRASSYQDLASVTVDIGFPAYVDEVLTTWFRPCKNLPDPGYTVETRLNSTGDWRKLLERSVWKENPCRTLTGDSGPTAFCADFFNPIVAQQFRVTFNNTAEHFLVGAGTDGGWLMEFEVHGIFLKTPHQLSTKSPPLSVKSGITVPVPPMVAESLNILGGATNASDPTVSRPVSLRLLFRMLDDYEDVTSDYLVNIGATALQGTHNFSSVALNRPLAGVYSLLFESAGLKSTNVSIAVSQGAPAFVKATAPATVYPSTDTVALNPVTVQAYDEGLNWCSADSVRRLVTVKAINSTTVLSGKLAVNMTGGTASFGAIEVVKPSTGIHVLEFESAGLRVGRLSVTVGVGSPAQLALMYDEPKLQSVEFVSIPMINVRILDAGGTFVESGAVSVEVDLLQSQSILSGNTTAVSVGGTAVFRGLTLASPKAGIYTLRFTAPSISGAVPVYANITVVSGPPAGIEIIAGSTAVPYQCTESTMLNAVTARLLDAGGEFIEKPSSDYTLTLSASRADDGSGVVATTNAHVNRTTGLAQWASGSLNMGAPKIGNVNVVVSGMLSGKQRTATFTASVTNGPAVSFNTDMSTILVLKAAERVHIPDIRLTELDAGGNRAMIDIGGANRIATASLVKLPGVLVGNTSVAVSNGEAVMSDLWLSSPNSERDYTLQFNITGLSKHARSQSFDVIPGDVKQLHRTNTDTLLSDNVGVIKGSPITVVARDGAGNAITSTIVVEASFVAGAVTSANRVALDGTKTATAAPTATFDDLVLRGRRGMIVPLLFRVVGLPVETNISIPIQSCEALMSGSVVNPTDIYNCYCQKGYTPTSGQAMCETCKVGDFKDTAGNGVCTSCHIRLAHTTSKRGAPSEGYCKCAIGFYYDSAASQCKMCDIASSTCLGGDVNTEAKPGDKTTDTMGPIYPKAGYWRAAAAKPWEILKCPSGSISCVGGVNSTSCRPNYHGPLCSLCIDDYAKQGDECVKCGDMGLNIFVFIVVALFLLIVGVYYVNKQMLGGISSQAAILKVIVSYVQILAFVGGFRARWGDLMEGFYTILGSAANMEVMKLQPIDCLFRANYYGNFFVFEALIPLCFLAPLLLYGLFRLPCFNRIQLSRVEEDKERRQRTHTRWFDIALWPLTLLFVVILPSIPAAIVRSYRAVRRWASPKVSGAVNRVCGEHLEGELEPAVAQEEALVRVTRTITLDVDEDRVRKAAKAAGDVLFESETTAGRSAISETKGAFWILLFFFLPTILKNTMELFNCVSIGGVLRVDRDLSVVCNTPMHAAVQLYGFWLSLVPVVVALIGYVVFKNVIVRKRRELVKYLPLYNLCTKDRDGNLRLPAGADAKTAAVLQREKRTLFRLRKYLFLFGGYRSDTGVLFMWDLVIMSRKIAIAAILVFARHQVVLQIFYSLIVFVLALVLHLVFRPFDDDYARQKGMPVLPSTLEFVSILATIFTLLCGFLFFLDDSSIMTPAALQGLDIVLMVINAGVLAVFVYLLFSSVLGDIWYGASRLADSPASQGAARWWRDKMGCCSWGVRETERDVEMNEVGGGSTAAAASRVSMPASGARARSNAAQQLPAGWDERVDEKTGRKYYVNRQKRLTQWERPQETEAAESVRI